MNLVISTLFFVFVFAEEFDYIIVGGGSSGCILANRLSANPKNNVLLLEAGFESQISSGGSQIFFTEENNQKWTYFDVPNQWWYVAFRPNNSWIWDINGTIQAKFLGGNGALNAMIYLRAIQRDFDKWNTEGWTFQDLLLYYLKLENNTGEITSKHRAVHGSSGLITVSDAIIKDLGSQLFVNSSVASGYRFNDDFEDGHRTNSAGYLQFNICNGIRDSSLQAYLVPLIGGKRPNLTVRTHAEVTKILFDITSTVPIAKGVEYQKYGVFHQVYAKKEVVISAGTINTPKLLLLSGIGGSTELKLLNIPVISDVQGVGKNLHDHLTANFVWFWNSPVKFESDVDQNLFLHGHKGIWATAGLTGCGYYGTPGETPDVQFTVFPRNARPDISLNPGLSVSITLQDTIARGNVTLKSSSWKDAPLVSRIHGIEHEDNKRVAKAVLELRRIETFEPLKSQVQELVPGMNYQTLEELTQWVAENINYMGHWVGTAKMGNFNTDKDVVVDKHLKVRGVERLRVVDASVIPYVPTGNIHATVLAIAERGADFILQEDNHIQESLSEKPPTFTTDESIGVMGESSLAPCLNSEIPELPFIQFQQQILDNSFDYSYYIESGDFDNDGHIDLVGLGIDGTIYRYQNPGQKGTPWKRHNLAWLQGGAVSMAVQDVDKDGWLDILVGYDFRDCLFNCTKGSGKVGWLQNPLAHHHNMNWTLFVIGDSIAPHRVYFIDFFGTGVQNDVLVVPMVGGAPTDPVDIKLWKAPKDPVKAENWGEAIVVHSGMHLVHGVTLFQPFTNSSLQGVISASEEGVSILLPNGTKETWTARIISKGELSEYYKSSSSVTVGKYLTDKNAFIGAIEPFHGNRFVVYLKNGNDSIDKVIWTRCVLENFGQPDPKTHNFGAHEVRAVDFDNDGIDEIFLRFRGPFKALFVYKLLGPNGPFVKHKVGNTGDSTVTFADFNQNGKLDFATIGYDVLGYSGPYINLYLQK